MCSAAIERKIDLKWVKPVFLLYSYIQGKESTMIFICAFCSQKQTLVHNLIPVCSKKISLVAIQLPCSKVAMQLPCSKVKSLRLRFFFSLFVILFVAKALMRSSYLLLLLHFLGSNPPQFRSYRSVKLTFQGGQKLHQVSFGLVLRCCNDDSA